MLPPLCLTFRFLSTCLSRAPVLDLLSQTFTLIGYWRRIQPNSKFNINDTWVVARDSRFCSGEKAISCDETRDVPTFIYSTPYQPTTRKALDFTMNLLLFMLLRWDPPL